MSALSFVLIDDSTPASALPQYGGPLTAPVLAQMAAALQDQLNVDLARWWGGAYSVRAGANSGDIATGEIVVAIVDSLPDQPDAVAYHDVSGGGVPVVFAARTQCQSLITGGYTLSSAISHELCETAGDVACNLWADADQAFAFARELCDAVESNSYVRGGVALSDFLLPSFFTNGSPGPYSFMQTRATADGDILTGVAALPFGTAPGGYQVRRNVGDGQTQVTGQMRAHRAAKARHWSSRLRKRGVRV